MKAALAEHLREGGWEVLDLGTSSTDSVDYPDYGYRLAEAIADGRAAKGASLCGSGIGISIARNPHPPSRRAPLSHRPSPPPPPAHNDPHHPPPPLPLPPPPRRPPRPPRPRA